MPAPPYASGICIPSRPISPSAGITSWGNFSSSSQRRAFGMISRSHISRTDACRTRCSSDSSKSIIVVSLGLWLVARARLGGAIALLGARGREHLYHDRLLRAAELRGVRLPIGDVQRLLGGERDLL